MLSRSTTPANGWALSNSTSAALHLYQCRQWYALPDVATYVIRHILSCYDDPLSCQATPSLTSRLTSSSNSCPTGTRFSSITTLVGPPLTCGEPQQHKKQSCPLTTKLRGNNPVCVLPPADPLIDECDSKDHPHLSPASA
jgi:hypothetical protein